jgi:hypothetical protein
MDKQTSIQTKNNTTANHAINSTIFDDIFINYKYRLQK